MLPRSTFDFAVAQGYNSTQKMKISAQAGLAVSFNLKPKVALQTGLYYYFNQAGQSQSAVFTDTANTRYSIGSDNSYKAHRLRLPIMVNYKSAGANHFMLGAGLYVDCALGGNLSYDASAVLTAQDGVQTNYFASGNLDPFTKDTKYLYYTVGQDEFSQKYRLYDGNILQRFDLGVCAEVGYNVSKVYVGVRADFGLLNIFNADLVGAGFRGHNFSLQFMVGYKIN